MRGIRAAVAAGLAVAVVAGCGGPMGPAGYDRAETPHARAVRLAAAWPGSASEQRWRTGYWPLDVPAEWLPADAFHNGEDKAAYLSGRLVLRGALPQTLSGKAEVVWADGSRLSLPLLSADRVFRGLTQGGAVCSGHCDAVLTVTGARPATRTVRTSRGAAVIPVWEFGVAGYAAPFTYPAVAAERLPDGGPSGPGPGSESAQWSGTSADGRTLTAMVEHGGCSEVLPGEVYETDAAVVLIAHTRSTARRGEACPAVVTAGPQDFRLTRPLGSRAVLDFVSGLPQAQQSGQPVQGG
ncbi:hypothetical protein [Kitasatospora paranensis]|uniref:Lipoprotein n=1 Tax=Kitasatospora paranensis TaxID=258053 RepID=A0ABW2G0M6_9ACTN